MSEENEIFRGTRPSENTRAEKPAPAKAADKVEPAQAVVSLKEEIPHVQAVAAPLANQADLDLHVETSDLWRISEQVKARIASLSSSNSAINHDLEEQEEKAKRLAQQLKSL